MMLNTFNLGANYPIFIEPIKAKKDPVNDKWMIPAYATDVKLIPEKAGHQRYFVKADKAWYYVVDNIGTEYWDEDGTKHVIKELGEEVPEGALLEAPIIPPTIKEQTALANAECSKRINAHWNQIGQLNASLGVYGEEDAANCAAWITANRDALVALIARADITEVDVTDGQYWPLYGD